MPVGPVAQGIEGPPPKRQVGRSIRPWIIGYFQRPSYNGITLASQARDAGSTPVGRYLGFSRKKSTNDTNI